MKRRDRSAMPDEVAHKAAEHIAAASAVRALGSQRFTAGQAVEARCPYTQAWRPAVVVEARDGWCRIEVAGKLDTAVNERLRPRKGS